MDDGSWEAEDREEGPVGQPTATASTYTYLPLLPSSAACGSFLPSSSFVMSSNNTR